VNIFLKKLLLDNLPRWCEGKYKSKINWENSVGYVVRFIYGDIKGQVKIINYINKNKHIIIKYNNETLDISISNFLKCKLGKLFGVRNGEFIFQIGESLLNDKRNLNIIDKEHRCDKYCCERKWYKYHCNKCSYEGWIIEGDLDRGYGCACCCNPSRVVVLGINTIWDTARWMCDLGVSEEDAKKYSCGSHKKITVKCPDCDKEKIATIYTIYDDKSISCTCRDGLSYNEKLMYSMLTQLTINFEKEYSPKYLERLEGERYSKKRSDFYLPDYNLVIEMDGEIGHKGGVLHGKSKKSLEELVEIDNWKDEQHLKHGVKTIRINCFKSSMEYIKVGILKSELNDIFDLYKVDWDKCEKFALGNLVKEVCDYWNNKEDWETTTDLSIKFHISPPTIRRYLKKGNEYGWCCYESRKKK